MPGTTHRTLIDEYLEAQQRLDTPVARFSKAWESGNGSLIEEKRRQLLPLDAPAAGEQYAFEVDLDACSGCKACVTACHSLNGLDATETWRDVGILLGGDQAAPYQQTITSACHHCEEPGCLEGCPVLAYEKDPFTGIVRHFDDQCIGCQYCILKCPYDVPKYNKRLGVVRKCDLCHQRLAEGEAPACAQACPTQAIRVVKVQRSTQGAVPFLPGTADPGITRPSTRYVGKGQIPGNAQPGDLAALRPQHAHLALVLLLVFTQAGYGLLFASLLHPAEGEGTAKFALFSGGALVAAGLCASVAHLGKPLRAWRIFLGLRKSWLSREALVFGLSAAFLFPGLACSLYPDLGFPAEPLLLAGLVLGLLGVSCSAMIYIDTRRRFWRASATAYRMAGTLLVFALLPLSPLGALVALLGKLLLETLALLESERHTKRLAGSARLLRGPLRRTLLLRYLLGLAGCAGLACGLRFSTALVLLLGELLERVLFFQAVDAPKMPGMPAGLEGKAHS